MVKLFSNSRNEVPEFTITDAIERAKLDLDCAYKNFEHALEPDLIDCYIYQLQAAQMRYKFLLNCAKDSKKNEQIL
jgi:hypothetical protein